MSEKLTQTIENSLNNTGEAAAERSKELLNSVERGQSEKLSENAERAQVESLFSKETSSSEKKRHTADGVPTAQRKPLPKMATKKDRRESYKNTMQQIGAEMTAPERLFSAVIHNPAVEKTSEVLSATVARPNAILAGSFCAFVLTLIVYVIARNMGYVLSGFETIGAFIAGWAIGLIYDYARAMIAGRPL